MTHHPSEATLLAYAAGSLDEGLSVVIAAHVGVCPACRDAVRVCEAVGGQLLATLQGADLAADALPRALARLDSPTPPAPAAPQAPPAMPSSMGFTPPHALSPYRLGRWHWVSPGIHHSLVLSRRAGRAGLHLLRSAPGTALPEHGHQGNELAYILTGSYTDETGRYRAGDFAEMDSDDEHKPVADRGEGCICLIATDAPLRFRGLLPRLLQPALGF